ncbi:sensor histidine kinase [Pseudonocardia sp. H11422]|uniref:sensor histidine kinase n=1 Tax=Pseudonocardia sp. H11422 TaxID=2835866 RepID=UPI001BDD486F|nr:histidine kinase [Pseudonocardia sp. H11422]
MMLEPAHCAGDAPRTAPEQRTSAAPTSDASRPDAPADPPATAPPAEAGPPTRLREPAREARRRKEREQWLRRRRLERQLHDGAALRISALVLQLGLFRHRVPAGEPDLHASIDGLQDELHAVLQELRDVAGKIYPPLLDEAGLGPALCEAAGRVESRVRICAPDDRFGPAAEGAAYFAVVDCLDTLTADAPPVEVTVRRDGAGLTVEVAGLDVRHAELMHDQVRLLGGTVEISALSAVVNGPGTGTITARIPCE